VDEALAPDKVHLDAGLINIMQQAPAALGWGALLASLRELVQHTGDIGAIRDRQ